MYVTYGYAVPVGIAFLGRDVFSLSKQVIKMTIESIGWRIYKESELSLSVGPYGLAGRFCQAMLWAPQNHLDITFDTPEKNVSVCLIKFQGPKKEFFDSPSAKAKMFQDIDNLWEKFYIIRMREICKLCGLIATSRSRTGLPMIKRYLFPSLRTRCLEVGMHRVPAAFKK